MTCPNSVPTITFRGCGGMILLTVDDFHTDTENIIGGFGGRTVRAGKEECRLSMVVRDDYYVSELGRIFTEIGLSPFAIYSKHMGQMRWWVVRLKKSGIRFDMDGSVWKIGEDVEVIGWAKDATEIGGAAYIVDDAGNRVVDDNGDQIRSDLAVGSATNITCVGEGNE